MATAKPNSSRPISVSTPNLTFTTKIIGPLLKSKFLGPKDAVALATTTRAMLIAVNVQDALCLNMPLIVSSPETVKYIEDYFSYQRFEITSTKVGTRKSIFQRRFSEKSRGPTSPSNSTERKKESRKRMTSWRFTTVVLNNEDSAKSFLSMMARDASPASQSLRSTLQTLEVRSSNIVFAQLAPLGRSLRTLVLVDVTGWPESEDDRDHGLLPILRDLTIKQNEGQVAGLHPNVISALFPKVESVELSCATDFPSQVVSGLSELKKIVVTGGARGDLVITSTKLREVGLLDQRHELVDEVSQCLRSHLLEQKGLRTLELRRSTFTKLIDVPVATSTVQTLDLSFNPSLTDISRLTSFLGLVNLNLSNCTVITELPDLSGATSLAKINLARCTNLASIKGIAGCPALTELNLSYCASLEDSEVEAISACSKLKKLDVSHCGLLTTLENACSAALEILVAVKCTNLQLLPGKAPSLVHLNCSGCGWLKTLSSFEDKPRLTIMNLHGCGRLQSLKPLAGLKHLRELECSFATVEGLDAVVQECPGLESLISNAHELEQNLSWATSNVVSPLQKIHLCAWKNLQDASHLESFALTLIELEITGSKIVTCEAFRNMSQLKVLRLPRSSRLTDVSALAGLPALAELNLEECSSLTSVEALGRSQSLRWLRLSRCEKLATLGAFEVCPSLKRIEVNGCERELSGDLVSMRALMMLEVQKRVATMYSKEAMKQWNEKEFEEVQKEFERLLPRLAMTQELLDVTSNKAAGGGCIVS